MNHEIERRKLGVVLAYTMGQWDDVTVDREEEDDVVNPLLEQISEVLQISENDLSLAFEAGQLVGHITAGIVCEQAWSDFLRTIHGSSIRMPDLAPPETE